VVASTWLRRLRECLGARPLTTVAALTVLVFYAAAFFPGVLTPDPTWMLMQIRGVAPVNDWHPPVITGLWHLLWLVFQHPGLLYLVQTALLVYLVARMARTVEPAWVGLLLTIVFPLLPPIVGNFAALWKDNWYVLWGIGASVSLYECARTGRPRSFIAGAVFTLLFVSTRHNAFFAALPLLYVVAVLGARKLAGRGRGTSGGRRLIAGIAIFVAMLVACTATNWLVYRLYVAKHFHAWQIPLWFDLTGVSVRSGELVMPEYLLHSEAAPTLERLAEVYDPASSDELIWSNDGKYTFPMSIQDRDVDQTDDQRRQLMWKWVEAVFTHPVAWLRHRWSVTRRLLGLGRRPVHAPFPSGITPNVFGWTFEPRWTTDRVYERLDPLAHSLFFRGWVYALALLAATAVAFKLRSGLVTRAMLVSGVGSLLGNFVLLGAADFRYNLWIVVVALVAPVWIWQDHRRHSGP